MLKCTFCFCNNVLFSYEAALEFIFLNFVARTKSQQLHGLLTAVNVLRILINKVYNMVETSLKGFSNFLIPSMFYYYHECGDTTRFQRHYDTKNAITRQSNELHLSNFGYHPLG